ncbi:MAG: hypothetical protein ACRC6I_10210, partial [Paracoccaceae bacterium]
KASPTLCVDPSQSQDLWGFAAKLHVTNTSGAPFDLVYNTGSMAGFSFRADRVADARDPREGIDYETGPIAAERAGISRITLAPGAEEVLIGDPRYILEPIQLAVKGERVDGSAAEADERFDRSFRVEFLAELVTYVGGEKRNITEEMPAILRIIVRDLARE